MNFLAQTTPLTPKKQRSSGLHSSNLTPTQHRHKHVTNDNLTVHITPHKDTTSTTSPFSSPTRTSLSPNHSVQTPTTSRSDRFIPTRSNIDFDYCQHELFSNTGIDENQLSSEARTTTTSNTTVPTDANGVLQTQVLLGLNQSPNKRLMNFSANHEDNNNNNLLDSTLNSPLKRSQHGAGLSPSLLSPKKKAARILPTGPSKILDAPGLRDDYYLNLLSWGCNNSIAIALHNSVYLYNTIDGHIEQLLELDEPDNYITSVQWSPAENILAVGTNGNVVEIWDSEKLMKTRTLTGHSGRVSSLSWNNGHVVSSGGRDSAILNHDIRQHRHLQSTYLGHQQEVCGLAWSPDGSTLASGGNENLLCIWDAAMSSGNNTRRSSIGGRSTMSSGGSSQRVLNQSSSTPRFQMNQHQAAVKALAWCPWQRGVFASGGGTADRSIRLWNAGLGSNLATIDTGSQVCAMQWSESHRELLSSHGFSDNQLCLWKPSSALTSLTKIREFKSHSARVLHLAQSPDCTKVVSAGADESLRFWDIFTTDSSYKGGYSGEGARRGGGAKSGGLLGGMSGMGMSGNFSLR